MVSRREFLSSLSYFGAIKKLPFNLADVSDEQIDQLCSELSEAPAVFEVEGKTIYAPWADAYPQVYGDAFDVPSEFDSHSKLFTEFGFCYELQSHFEWLFEDARMEEGSLAWKIDQKFGSDAFEEWIRQMPLDELNSEVRNWLDMDLPCGFEHSLESGPVGEAYAFFLRQDSEILDALGVVIVEGDHPGSSYYAAELEISIEDANYAATTLNIPIKFK